MIACYAYKTKLEILEFSQVSILAAIKQKKRLWFNVSMPTKEEFAVLENIFGLHPVTIEDCFMSNTRIKVEAFENYLFCVFYSIVMDGRPKFIEHDFILGKDYLITNISEENESLKAFKQNMYKIELLMRKGTDYLFHNLLDLAIDSFFPILESLDAELEELDKRCFNDRNPDLPIRLDSMKDTINSIRRKAFNQREKMTMI